MREMLIFNLKINYIIVDIKWGIIYVRIFAVTTLSFKGLIFSSVLGSMNKVSTLDYVSANRNIKWSFNILKDFPISNGSRRDIASIFHL